MIEHDSFVCNVLQCSNPVASKPVMLVRSKGCTARPDFLMFFVNPTSLGQNLRAFPAPGVQRVTISISLNLSCCVVALANEL